MASRYEKYEFQIIKNQANCNIYNLAYCGKMVLKIKVLIPKLFLSVILAAKSTQIF